MSEEVKNFGIPTFSFDSTAVAVSAAEAKKLLEVPRLPAYEYSRLEVLRVEYRGVLEKDKTWGKFSFTLGLPGSKIGPDGKVVNKDGKPSQGIFHLLCVPLSNNNLYADETAPRMADRFCKFINGMGFNLEIDSYGPFVQSHFATENKLKGKQLTAYLGYEKDHIAFADGNYFVADRKGQPHKFEGNSFENREQAEGKALSLEIDTDKAFLRVLKVKPPETAGGDIQGSVDDVEVTIAPLEDGDY